MEGIIVYNNYNVLGTIDKNTEAGIYGTIDRIDEVFEEQIPIKPPKRKRSSKAMRQSGVISTMSSKSMISR